MCILCCGGGYENIFHAFCFLFCCIICGDGGGGEGDGDGADGADGADGGYEVIMRNHVQHLCEIHKRHYSHPHHLIYHCSYD